MSQTSLVITYSGKSSQGDLWVRLEQIEPPPVMTKASLESVYQMWVRAATGGGSAGLMRTEGCPVQFDGDEVLVILGFYAWASTLSLTYELTAAVGTVTGGAIVRKQREFSQVVSNSSNISLPYYMEDVQLVWETPVFADDNSETAVPDYVVRDGVVVELSQSVFGVVRIYGVAVGKQYNSLMTFDKSIVEDPDVPRSDPYPKGAIMINVVPALARNSVRVSNIDNTITATWLDPNTGENELDQLRLAIPTCVTDILSLCPDAFRTLYLVCQSTRKLYVYFNACKDDEILFHTLSGEDDDSTTSFCADISGTKSASLNPYGVLPVSS